jgi:predicted nucleic-acid-binding Zn-ribbon protein
MEEPLGDDEREVYSLEPAEQDDVRADLEDLEGMRRVFGVQGVKGVVIACPDCGENHFYE